VATSSTTRLLLELIARPSVNPAFLPAGDIRAGEAGVADFLEGLAGPGGLDFERSEVLPGRFNVIVRLTPSATIRQRVLLAPHLDTVGFPVLDEQLQPRLDKGRVHGRGACDTKGCVAAMFQALLQVARSGRRPQETEILFVGLIDEENGQAGSRHFALHGPKAALAVVGEPTRLRVVTAHKGDVWLRIKTRGRSAHGATPHRGRNAVLAMARVVEVIEGEYGPSLQQRRHPLLGTATVNVGSIQGGSQPNIVPDECVISVDRRTLPGETEADVRRELRQHLRRHGLAVTFENLRLAPCPPLETEPDLPLVRQLCRSASQRRTWGVDYFCDAAPLSAGGIPSVVFGPGDIAQAHTADEWISVASLDRGTAILENFLRSLP
jgi:succinyl-diaminopimelate desuccinylase